MSLRWFFFFFTFLFVLNGCAIGPETPLSPTPLPTTTTTLPTATAVLPATTKQGTSTPMAVPPTATTPPTAIPTTVPSPTTNMPADPLVISPENAEQLTQLAQFGNGSIDSITWSPDGTFFVTGGSQRIDFYDATTLQRVRTIGTYEDPGFTIDYLSFSPQGDVLVLFTHGYTVPWATLWDTASGQELRPLDTWMVPVFTSDGQTIVYVNYAAGPLFWEDVRTGDRQGTVQLELGESSWHKLSPGGEMLAEVNVDDTDRMVRLWDTASGQLLHTIEASAAFYGIAFSPQGDLLAIPGEDGIVRVWEVPGGQLLHEVEGGTAVFSPDGRILATSGVRLWDMTTGQLLHTLTLPQGRVCGRSSTAVFSPDGRELAVASVSGVLFFDVASGELQRSLDGYCFASDLAFSPDSNALITAGGYDVRTLDVQSGQLLDTRRSNEPVWSIAISPDGSLMAWGGGEQQYWVQLWDVASGGALYAIEDATQPVDEVVFSPDGQLLATQTGLGQEPLVQLRATSTGRLLFSHEASRFAFSPDGRLFATSWHLWSGNATIELWDVTTFQSVRRFEQLALLAFSPDGNILAQRLGENRDGSVVITTGWWDIDSGELLRTFVEEEFTSYRVFAFSPDNRLLLGHEAGAMGYGHTTLWDVATGEKMSWESNPAATGAFSSDGRFLATVSSDGVVRLWGLLSGTR